MATPAVRARFEQSLAAAAPGVPVTLLEGRARVALAAADVVLVASGTATLETLLSKRPMVVAYRLAATTFFLLRRLGLVKVQHVAQPNLLLGARVVPELLQEDVRPETLGAAVLAELDASRRGSDLERRFLDVHRSLRQGGAALAAQAILELAGRGHDRP
jgi:lipid-A-disaccharide synthase